MLKLNDQLIQKRLLWRTTIKAFTSCWLLQMWLTTIIVVYKVLLFDRFCHLSTFTSSLKELCPSFIGQEEDSHKSCLGITKQTNHGTWVRCKKSVTRYFAKITLFNHCRLYHTWWFSRWWGVESNSIEASRSYNLYNRLLQLVTCRANDNQDDESDKWSW